jgi:hypothetical protein
MAVENMEDLNAATEDTANMDMNMDMNMDVNATANATEGTETTAGNEATNNSY